MRGVVARGVEVSPRKLKGIWSHKQGRGETFVMGVRQDGGITVDVLSSPNLRESSARPAPDRYC